MNIGGELMRRYAPRPPSPGGAGGRPGIGAWIAAALVLLVGVSVVCGLAYAGFRSEAAARFAVTALFVVIGAAIVVAIIRWFAAPISENAEFAAPDVGRFLLGSRRFRSMSLDGHPVGIALALVAVLAVDGAFELSVHWKWAHARRRSPVLLRLLLAPDLSPGTPTPGPAPGDAAPNAVAPSP